MSGSPNGWRSAEGRDPFSLAGGYGPSSINFAEDGDGDAFFIKVNAFNLLGNERCIRRSEETFNRGDNPKIRCYGSGTLVFPKRGAAIFKNRVRLLAEPTAVDPNLMVLIPSAALDPSFFRYALLQTGLYNLSDNSGIPQLNNKHLYPARFLAPPLPEQRKIAEILLSVDEAIEATQAVIDQVQVVKRGLMQELLTNGLPGRHKKFKQTEVGQIPEEWKVVELGSVLASIEAGWSPRCQAGAATGDQWGILKVSAVSWGRFKEEENKRLEEGLTPRPEIRVRPGDVLISRANTTELVGRPVLVDDCERNVMLSDKTLRLVPGPGLDRRFLVLSLVGDAARRYIEAKATGSSKSMKNISQKKLRAFQFGLPTLAEQQEIGGCIASVDLRLRMESLAVSRLQAVKRALLNVLLNGELRVPVEASGK